MALLSFTLSEEGVAAFRDALICLNKFSDDVSLEARKDSVRSTNRFEEHHLEPATYKLLIVRFDHSKYFQIRLCECQVCYDQVLLTIPLSGESSIP